VADGGYLARRVATVMGPCDLMTARCLTRSEPPLHRRQTRVGGRG
jgi:hypothetical protein